MNLELSKHRGYSQLFKDSSLGREVDIGLSPKISAKTAVLNQSMGGPYAHNYHHMALNSLRRVLRNCQWTGEWNILRDGHGLWRLVRHLFSLEQVGESFKGLRQI